MQVSAEIRWFWPKNGETELFRWFANGLRTISGDQLPDPEVRDDLYLPGSDELGIKKRGGVDSIEVKALVAKLPASDLAPGVRVGIEIWTKCRTEHRLLDYARPICTTKTRWLRKFESHPANGADGVTEVKADARPSAGCNVEFTQIEVGSNTWESFGFEAFGSLSDIESSLRQTVRFLSGSLPPLPATAGYSSYPAWLAGLKK